MVDYRYENKYILSFSNKFLKDFRVNKIDFIDWVKRYINDFYLKNRPQMYSIKVWEVIIRFHKIDVVENNKSNQRWNRIIVFFMLNNPDGINTIYLIF